MAIKTKVQNSPIQPIKSNAFVEVVVETDASEAVSGSIALGKTYKSVRLLSTGVLSKGSAAYTGAVAVKLIDNGTVEVTAAAVSGANPLITATLICEVS